MKFEKKANSRLRMWNFHLRQFVKVITILITVAAAGQPILTNCSTRKFSQPLFRELVKSVVEKKEREKKIPVAAFLVCKKAQFFTLNKNKNAGLGHFSFF
jgi:hypothetical protein